MATIGRALTITLTEDEDSFFFPPDAVAGELCILSCRRSLEPSQSGWTQMSPGLFWRRLSGNEYGQFVQLHS